MIPEQLLNKAIAKGSDNDFQAYVRLWPSVLTNDYKEWHNGEGRSVFAHHREVAAGAGIAHKPPYCGYPLTQEQHANTHQYGLNYYESEQWWQDKAIMMLVNWVNNVKPPMLPEKRTKERYIIGAANHLNALKEMLAPYFMNPKAKPVEVIIQTGKKRTAKQNSGMWGVIYDDIVDFYSDNPEALAKDVVEYVLLHKPSNDFVHEIMKGLCNDNQSTASLRVQEHCNYFDRVANRFQEKHQHEVKMPVNNYGYNEFYGEDL